MTVQEIHRYIWNGIVHALKSKKYVDVITTKRAIVQKMHDNGMISEGAYNTLLSNMGCVLCAVYMEYCSHCPLEYCSNDCSDYLQVVDNNDIEAARTIRNVDVRSGNKSKNGYVAADMQRVINILES